ncbi:hypothetical protein GGI05_004494, partial [Coemansia sp. RSA 2603]
AAEGATETTPTTTTMEITNSNHGDPMATASMEQPAAPATPMRVPATALDSSDSLTATHRNSWRPSASPRSSMDVDIVEQMGQGDHSPGSVPAVCVNAIAVEA